MKLGVCTSPENNALAAQAGFDYIECALNGIAAMPDAEFAQLKHSVPSMPLPILKCNCFLPGNIKITGPDVSETAWESYLEKALSRAHDIGVKLLVLGSGAARQVPDGWAFESAWRQLSAFLKLAHVYAEKYDMDIVLEPLRRKECNFLNLVSEATILSALENLPRINVLGDSFHMICCHEPWNALEHAGERLHHVHISCPLPDLSSRVYPAPGDGADYEGLIQTLKSMHYQGDISVEAGCKDFVADGAQAVKCLKPLMAE